MMMMTSSSSKRTMPSLRLLLLLLLVGYASGSNILVLSPYTCKSHSNFFMPIVKTLASRGHTITYWNGLEPKAPMANVRQLFSESLRELNTNYDVEFGRNNPLLMFLDFPSRVSRLCSLCFQEPIFHQLMAGSEQFDLIIVEAVLNECMLPLVSRLNVPFIYLNSIMPTPWMLDAVGSPMLFDHVPVVSTDFTDQMYLYQRLWNTLTGVFMITFRNAFILPRVNEAAAKYGVGQHLPPIGQVEKNVSLLITNSHLSINYQFAKPAAIIEAGGLHCVARKPLPDDLQDFVGGSGDAGFIYLSFGSILRGADLPEATKRVFVNVFARLPQRVIWKYEDEAGMADLPANVKLVSWLPQQDLLGHDNIKLFISHGGLFSIQETVYHGVPFIGLPVFADQFNNVVKAERDGYARFMNWDSLTEQALYDTIRDMVTQSMYRERIQHASLLLRDQPSRPLDRAIFWIEYVIRHGGATHLHTAVRHQPLYQRALLDVTMLMACIFALLAWAGYRLLRSMCCASFRSSASSTSCSSSSASSGISSADLDPASSKKNPRFSG